MRFGRLKLSGHDLTSRDRRMPPGGLTNDGVVVASELAGLDFGFEFHTILPCGSDV